MGEISSCVDGIGSRAPHRHKNVHLAKMKKESSKPSRLSDFDLWNALGRNENYLRDRRFYYDQSPMGLFGDDRIRCEQIAQAMDALGAAALVDPENIPEQIKRAKAGNALSPTPVARLRGYHEKNRITFIKDKQFILVEVDLTAQKDRIEKAVWNLVCEIRNNPKLASGKTKSLESEPNEDLWRVYDAHKRGTSIYALARQRLKERFPNNHKQVERSLPAEDKQLRRYITKAKSMIRQVYPIT